MTDEIVREARERLQESWRYDQDNRREALEDLKFVAGFQWSDQARAERGNRPAITINRAPQFLRQVSNPIRQNIPALKVVAENHTSSKDLANIFNGLMRQIQVQSSAGHVYANALEHCVGCGIGWFRFTTDYCDDATWDQEIRIKRVFNPLAVYPDPAAKEPDRSDMGWCIVSEVWPRRAFEKRWPKAATTGMEPPTDSGSQAQIWWRTGDYIRVAEYWRRTEVPKTLALLDNGDVVCLSDMGEAQAGLILQSGRVRDMRKGKGWRVDMTLVSGQDQLEETSPWAGSWIPLVPVVGAEVPLERSVYRHGLIRFQREPQQLHNYFMSLAAETLQQAPKAPWLGTAVQIAKHKAMWDRAGTSAQPYLLYDHDPQAPNSKPERQRPPEFPAGTMEMARILSDDMKATTGIYDASLGQRSNETSGVAINARKAEGAESTFHFVDNLEHSLEHAGRILIELIPRIYDNERIIRIVSDDEKETWAPINRQTYAQNGMPVLINDLSAAKFDIRVVLGTNYATQRREAVQTLLEVIRAVPQAVQVAGDLIAKNLDIPGSEQLAERLRMLLPPQIQAMDGKPPPPPPDPLADPVIRADVTLKDAQAEKTYADAAKVRAELAMLGIQQPPQPLPPPEAMLMQPPPQMPQQSQPPEMEGMEQGMTQAPQMGPAPPPNGLPPGQAMPMRFPPGMGPAGGALQH